MQTAAVLPAASTLSSATPQAKQAPTSAADTTFNQVLAHQIQGRKKGKEPEKTTDNNAKSTSETDVAIPKEDGSESLSDVENITEAALPVIDTIPAIPVELLALVANINQIINQSDNANSPHQLSESLQSESLQSESLESDLLQPISSDELSKEPLAMLDSKQNKLNHFPQISNKSGQINRFGDGTATSADRHVGLQTEFGATAQKIHEAAIPTSPPVIAQMPQAPLNLLQASTTQLTEKLMLQVGTQGWDQALGQKIVWMVAGSQQSATLTLNPPDLGPLQIILNVSNDQADATFISAQPEVRHALEAALPKLREMMNEAGIQLSDATVSSNTSNQQGASQQHSRKALQNFKESNLNTAAVSQPIQTRPLITGKQMVDTFA